MNQWVHVALVRDTVNDIVTIYEDGVEKDSFTGFFSTGALEALQVLVGNEKNCDADTIFCIGMERQLQGSWA